MGGTLALHAREGSRLYHWAHSHSTPSHEQLFFPTACVHFAPDDTHDKEVRRLCTQQHRQAWSTLHVPVCAHTGHLSKEW